jgi:hypothetical protein
VGGWGGGGGGAEGGDGGEAARVRTRPSAALRKDSCEGGEAARGAKLRGSERVRLRLFFCARFASSYSCSRFVATLEKLLNCRRLAFSAFLSA